MAGNFGQSLVEGKPEYIESLLFLELQGVFEGFTSRAGSPMARFKHKDTVVFGRAAVTDTAVTEADRNTLLGHLFLKAAPLP